MRILFQLGFAFILVLLFFSASSSPIDSIKVIRNKDKKFIIHKVDKGEGLLSIARRYNVTVDDIKANNKDVKKLKLGQKIKIPLNDLQGPVSRNDSSRIRVDDSHANADSKELSPFKTHVVQPGETVYRIAAKYKISTQQLINWNAIKNNKIDAGQELVVSGNLSTLPFEKWNAANSLTAKSTMPKDVLSTDTALVEENGFAILLNENTHPTINPGSMILVINPDNNKQCLVQIQKKAVTPESTIIGLTQGILDQLGVTDTQSRIIIKYNQ